MAEIKSVFYEIKYKGQDITPDIRPSVISVEFTDNLDGEIDEINITLDDSEEKWKNAWYPTKTDKISIVLGYEDESLDCGEFEIDEIEISGGPDSVSLKAVSAAVTKTLKTRHSKAYKDKTLKEIIQEVALRNGLKIEGNIDEIKHVRVTQNRMYDINFLKRLGKQYGYFVNIKGKTLLFKKIDEFKQAKIVREYIKSDLKSYSFKDRTSQIYKSAKISYWDPVKKTLLTHSEDASGLKTGDELIIKDRVENKTQAVARCKAALSGVNDRQVECSLEVIGDVELRAGKAIKIVDFGAVSGKYTIKRAVHSISRDSGYSCSLELMRNEVKSDDPSIASGISDKFKYKTIVSTLARPHEIVAMDGFSMQAETARRWQDLKKLINGRFPGRTITVTSTMGGTHSSGAHPEGRAIDFCVSGMTKQESRCLEVLCEQAGFKPYNEYIYDSTYKTGDHMHVSWE